MSADQTIFVSIAAYRDPQLVPTVEDCLAQARHPERLRFGICWQHGPDEGPLPWAGDPRFRIIDVPWQDSRGACWARAEVMARYGGEDYFLQIDSHHRFVEGWDEAAIAELRLAPSPRPVLTAYVTPFDPEHPEAREHVPMQMNFDRFTEQGIVLCRPGELRDWQTRTAPAHARFLSAHFLFAPGAFVRDVPYDPGLYFTGEEITMAVRAFTHGYDLFHLHVMLAWHEYTRAYRPHKHWTDHDGGPAVEMAWHARDQASLARAEAFLASARGGATGVGHGPFVRRLRGLRRRQLRRRSGACRSSTRAGYEPPNPPADLGWADRSAPTRSTLAIEKSRLPAGVDDYQFLVCRRARRTGPRDRPPGRRPRRRQGAHGDGRSARAGALRVRDRSRARELDGLAGERLPRLARAHRRPDRAPAPAGHAGHGAGGPRPRGPGAVVPPLLPR
ncbi:MAG: GlcNAc-transferase family protein [Vicinamibacterales bacterium]